MTPPLTALLIFVITAISAAMSSAAAQSHAAATATGAAAGTAVMVTPYIDDAIRLADLPAGEALFVFVALIFFYEIFAGATKRVSIVARWTGRHDRERMLAQIAQLHSDNEQLKRQLDRAHERMDELQRSLNRAHQRLTEMGAPECKSNDSDA